MPVFTSVDEANAYIASMQTERKLSCKVGEKGGVSVYGLNVRFPITLYAQQWERLLDAAPEIRAFMVKHAAELTTKDGEPFVPNGANNAGNTRNGPVATRTRKA